MYILCVRTALISCNHTCNLAPLTSQGRTARSGIRMAGLHASSRFWRAKVRKGARVRLFPALPLVCMYVCMQRITDQCPIGWQGSRTYILLRRCYPSVCASFFLRSVFPGGPTDRAQAYLVCKCGRTACVYVMQRPCSRKKRARPNGGAGAGRTNTNHTAALSAYNIDMLPCPGRNQGTEH